MYLHPAFPGLQESKIYCGKKRERKKSGFQAGVHNEYRESHYCNYEMDRDSQV